MVCKRCNSTIANTYNGNKCPYCDAPLNKGYKNKYVKNDNMTASGTNVASKSFISFQKNKNKKDIELKNFNNYIDYKTAKEKEEDKKRGKYYNVYSKRNNDSLTGASSGQAKYVRKKKNTNSNTSSTFRNTESSSYKEFVGKQINSNDDFISGKNYYDKQGYVEPRLYTVETKENISQPAIKIGVDYKRKDNGLKSFSFVCVMLMVIVIALFLYKSYANNGFYFGEDTKYINQQGKMYTVDNDDEMMQYTGVSKSGQVNSPAKVGYTSIVYDNQYFNQLTFKGPDDVYRLIISDSNRQKSNCLAEIVDIEKEIIDKYEITAVNLCEMDLEFAKEIRDVIAYYYNKYPTARGYLTNITLGNDNRSFMAAFMPMFTFGTSKTNNKFPVAMKSQIILNAKYFLDNDKFTNGVKASSNSGYFPPNATKASTLAHEFGHYLAYVALCNHYNTNKFLFVKGADAEVMNKVFDDFDASYYSYEMLQEAYKKYQNTYHNDLSFYDFRKSISSYAVVKDANGNYVYDETIAEAFHDYYINKEMAQPASKFIVEVVISHL